MSSTKKQSPIGSTQSPQKRNTDSLGARISSDFISALCASTIIAPLITLVDKSIIIRTHNPEPLFNIFLSSLRTAIRRPFNFVTSAPFILINSVYFATYSTANLTDTVSSTLRNKAPSTVTSGPAKFLATSTANLSLSMYKDARFTKMFGAGVSDAAKAAAKSAAKSTVKKPVPMASLALFATRDSMTMFASFNVPAVLGPMIGSVAAAQFLAPATIQFVSTPLHLLGLDMYNRPKQENKLSWGDRFSMVRRDWLQASLGRIGRIVPAYGLGGVINTSMRKQLITPLD